MTPTLKQLRYLVALAEAGHFGRAAERCAVTQPTLSAAVAELEAGLKAQLVDRSRRGGVTLTPTGEAVVTRARRILADMEDLTACARQAQDPLTGPLRLGVIPTVAPFFLPQALPQVRARYPALQLMLREDLTERLVERLLAGTLDVLLLAYPYEHPGLDGQELFEDPFHYCAPDSALTPPPRLADLAGAPLLLLEDGHCLRDHVLEACQLQGRGHGSGHGSGQIRGFEATSLHTLVQMVEHGLGVTLVPDMAVRAGILDGTGLSAARFQGSQPARSIALAWRRGCPRAGEFALLAETLATCSAATADAAVTGVAASTPDAAPQRV